jgi:hypothetical protein
LIRSRVPPPQISARKPQLISAQRKFAGPRPRPVSRVQLWHAVRRQLRHGQQQLAAFGHALSTDLRRSFAAIRRRSTSPATNEGLETRVIPRVSRALFRHNGCGDGGNRILPRLPRRSADTPPIPRNSEDFRVRSSMLSGSHSCSIWFRCGQIVGKSVRSDNQPPSDRDRRSARRARLLSAARSAESGRSERRERSRL